MNNKEFTTYCALAMTSYCLNRQLDKKEQEIISLFQDALERLDGTTSA